MNGHKANIILKRLKCKTVIRIKMKHFEFELSEIKCSIHYHPFSCSDAIGDILGLNTNCWENQIELKR